MSILTMSVAAPAPARAQGAGASITVSARVLRPAVAPAQLDTAIARALRHSLAEPHRVQRIDDLPGGAHVVLARRPEPSAIRQVRVEYTAN